MSKSAFVEGVGHDWAGILGGRIHPHQLLLSENYLFYQTSTVNSLFCRKARMWRTQFWPQQRAVKIDQQKKQVG